MTISTSSTNLKIRLVDSALRYPGVSTTTTVRGSASRAARARVCADAGASEKGTGDIWWRASCASVDTQLGDAGQGGRLIPGPDRGPGRPWHPTAPRAKPTSAQRVRKCCTGIGLEYASSGGKRPDREKCSP